MLESFYEQLIQDIISQQLYVHLAIIALALTMAWLAARFIDPYLSAEHPFWDDKPKLFVRQLIPRLHLLVKPLLCTLALLLARPLLHKVSSSEFLLPYVLNACYIWLVTVSFWSITFSRNLTTLMAILATSALTLHLLGVLNPTVAFLQSLTIPLGSHETTLYQLLKGALLLVVLLSLTRKALTWSQQSIHRLSSLNVNTRELLIKLCQITLYFLIFVVLLDFLGFNLTSLTIFSGAIAVSVGLAAQKSVANFLSGLTLLFEKSLKIGDILELENGAWAWVRHLGARATWLECFDGREVVMPNEELATKAFTNLTYHHRRQRLEFKVPLPYDSDVEGLLAEMRETLSRVPSLSKVWPARCYLNEFSERGALVLVHIWVDDVSLGRFQPQNDAMVALWKLLRERGVDIPYQVYTIEKGAVDLAGDLLN